MAESSLAAAFQAKAERAAQQPKVFIDTSGKAIPIFLSVEYIRDRPKIVRLLTVRPFLHVLPPFFKPLMTLHV